MENNKTKDLLIDAAERLFGEHGIKGVSLRQINTEAGQRNASAVHYHFGTKEELVRAIFLKRLPIAGRIREQMLDAAEQAPEADRPALLVRALVMPLAANMLDLNLSEDFIRLLVQVRMDLTLDWAEIESTSHAASLERLYDAVAAMMPEEDARSMRRRMAVLHSMTINGVSDIATYRERQRKAGKEVDVVLALENLMAMTTAALCAPLELAALKIGDSFDFSSGTGNRKEDLIHA